MFFYKQICFTTRSPRQKSFKEVFVWFLIYTCIIKVLYFSDEKILRKYWAWKETRTFARHPKQKASWHPIANPEISNSTQQIPRNGLFRWRWRTRSTSHYTAIYFESKHFQHLQNGGQSSVQLSGVLHTYTYLISNQLVFKTISRIIGPKPSRIELQERRFGIHSPPSGW